MRAFVSLVFVLLSAASFTAQQDSTPIRNFLRVNKDFCTGGQPRLEHLEQLKADGVKAIINLRQPSEHRAAEEEAKAKELGLRYFNIPVAVGNPKDEQADEFLKITDDPENRPAFIHCTAAVRVGAFWMIRRVLRDGWTIADAEKEAEKIGLRENPHLTEFARQYIAKHQKQQGASLPSLANGDSGPRSFESDRLGFANEDGEIFVITAGDKFVHVGTNSMGELLMATPALSEGVMYVRTAQTLFAVGRKK